MALTRALTRTLSSGLVVPLTGGDSGFSPLSLGSLMAWYDASQLGLANGTGIATWPDLSGNGHDLTQATGSKQPTVASASLNALTTAAFASASAQSVQSAAFTLNQPATVFVVAKASNTASYFTDGRAVNTRVMQPNTASVFRLYAGAILDVTEPTALTGFSILHAVFNGTSSISAQNGVETSGSAGTATASGITLGSDGSGNTGALNGNIAEAIFCGAALAKADRNSVVAYLGAKWGVTVTLS